MLGVQLHVVCDATGPAGPAPHAVIDENSNSGSHTGATSPGRMMRIVKAEDGHLCILTCLEVM